MVATSGLEVLPYLINNKTYILTHRYFGLPRWWRLCAANAGGLGLIPGWGNKIPYAMQWGQKIFFFFNLRTQVFHKWGYPNGHKSHETVPTSIPHQRNTHKTRERYHYTPIETHNPSAGETGGSAEQCGPSGNSLAISQLKAHHATQQTPPWVLTKRNKSAHPHTHKNYIRNCLQLWSCG